MPKQGTVAPFWPAPAKQAEIYPKALRPLVPGAGVACRRAVALHFLGPDPNRLASENTVQHVEREYVRIGRRGYGRGP